MNAFRPSANQKNFSSSLSIGKRMQTIKARNGVRLEYNFERKVARLGMGINKKCEWKKAIITKMI